MFSIPKLRPEPLVKKYLAYNPMFLLCVGLWNSGMYSGCSLQQDHLLCVVDSISFLFCWPWRLLRSFTLPCRNGPSPPSLMLLVWFYHGAYLPHQKLCGDQWAGPMLNNSSIFVSPSSVPNKPFGDENGLSKCLIIQPRDCVSYFLYS